MPANEIMQDFRERRLHSGRGGPIVKKKSQAQAIRLSYLRKEGRGVHRTYARLKHGG